MMTTFTDWDIIRNLLLAGRWTVLLSLVAFVGGAVVTLPLLLLRLTGGRDGEAHYPRLYRAVSGHPAADAAVPGLLWCGAVRHRRLAVDRRLAGVNLLHQRISARYLVRQHSRPAEGAVGTRAVWD